MSDKISTDLRLTYVSYGDADDEMFASGVPHYLRRGFESATGVVVREVATRPSRGIRLIIKALSFRPQRAAWERNYLHGRLLPLARSWKRLRGVRAARGTDAVLHVRTWYSPIDVPYASFIDATVTMVRGYDDTWSLTDRQFEAERRTEGEFYRRAVVVYTASRAASASLVDDYGIPEERIVQVGAGTTLPGLKVLEAGAVARRYERPGLLFVGKDPVRKGLPELLAAFEIARADIPDLTLTIVGPTQDDPRYQAAGIRWLGRINDKNKMAKLYEDASVFALTAHRESYGLVVPEAMSYGVPCIVSNVGELPHLVTDGVDGIVLSEVQSEHIARAICSMFSSSESYAETSHAAHRRAQDFDWVRIAQTMTDDLISRLKPTQGS